MADPPTAVAEDAAPAPDRSWRRRPHPAALACLALVVVLTGWHAREASQHLLTDRDPGVYVTAGRWLAREGSLLVEPATGPFAEADDLVYEQQGWNRGDDGRLEPQFLHLLPVVLAAAHLVGGDRLLLVAPSLLAGAALLAVAAFARKVVGPWWALVATAALAASLPWVHLSRDAFSEPLVTALLFAGLAVLWDAREPGAGRWRGPVGGLLLGAVATARVEGFVLLLPLVGVAALSVASARRRGASGGRDAAVAVGALLGLLVGPTLAAVDLRRAGTWYLDDLSGLLALVAAGLAVVVLAGAAVVAVPIPAAAPAVRRRAGLALGAGLVLVVAGGWFVRPVATEVTGAPAPAIAAIELEEGRAGEGIRRYSEDSVHWLAWYQGPAAVALGAVGAALALHAAVVGGPSDRRIVPFLAVAATLSALYLWRPSIVPDHVWVMRRYALVTLPALAILGAAAGRAAVGHLRRADRPRLAVAATVAVAVALVAVPASTLVPVAGATTQEGLLQKVGDVCDELEGSAALVVPGDDAELVLPQTLRSFCGVPVATAGPDLDPAAVRSLSAAWVAAGRDLRIVGSDPAAVARLAGSAPVLVVGIPNDELLERTLTGRPDDLEARPVTLVVARVGERP